MTSTSINVNKDLWHKAKLEAVRRNITITKLVELSLKRELNLN